MVILVSESRRDPYVTLDGIGPLCQVQRNAVIRHEVTVDDFLVAGHAGDSLRFLSKSHKHHVQWGMILGLYLLIVFLILALSTYFRGFN